MHNKIKAEIELTTTDTQHHPPIPPLLLSEPGMTLSSQETATFKRRRKGWEKILLVVEIIIIAGFLATFWNSTRLWAVLRQRLPTQDINLVSEQVLAANIPDAATISGDGISNQMLVNQPVVSPPTEIPTHLKPLLKPETNVPTIVIPEPVPQPGTRIVIPSIGVDATIGEGTDWEALKYQVGHHPGTANPGERGNSVLAAHNDIYGEIFRYLPDVPLGEVITIYAGAESFRYRITERKIIRPQQTEVMLPTTEPTVTLISCYPYLIDTHRIVLFGELVQ